MSIPPIKRALSRKPRRFTLSSQDPHILEPRYLLTAVNIGSLTGGLPQPNHAGLSIGHAVVPATHTPASVGVHAALTTGTSTHGGGATTQRLAATHHSTSTLASIVTARPSATKHAGAATASHAGQVKDAATGLTFYRARSTGHTTAQPALKSSSAVPIVPNLTAQTATAASPNASSASSVIVDCAALAAKLQAGIDSDRDSYNQDVSDFKQNLIIYQNDVISWQLDRNSFQIAQGAFNADVRAFDAKYGNALNLSAEAAIGTGLPALSVKLSVDLTKLMKGFDQNSIEQQIAAFQQRLDGPNGLNATLGSLRSRRTGLDSEGAQLQLIDKALHAQKSKIDQEVQQANDQLAASGCEERVAENLDDAPDVVIADLPDPLDGIMFA